MVYNIDARMVRHGLFKEGPYFISFAVAPKDYKEFPQVTDATAWDVVTDATMQAISNRFVVDVDDITTIREIYEMLWEANKEKEENRDVL